MHDSALDNAFRDLDEACDDFVDVPYQNARSILRRFPIAFQEEPLASFLRVALPTVDYLSWMAQVMASRGGMVGSGRVEFPADRGARVALQVGLIEELASDDQKLLGFAHEYCNAGYNSISAHYQEFARTILRPFLRDLQRLAESRVLPPILFDMLGSVPPSGDAILDQLIADAVARFKDSTPTVRKEALERLWDAWERLKSLEAAGDKRMSASVLLDRGASSQEFRAVLETEARALTVIGNQFHIRHFETNKVALERDSHVDYLFHRLFAMMHLLLFARAS